MTAVAVERQLVRPRAQIRPVPWSRLVLIELRKMFDTRSGFWLMASIGISAVVATGAVILFAPDDELTYSTFAAAFGFPMAVILPVVAILAVTSEWSQRSGLTTFTLVPRRGRVLAAKAAAAVAVGALSIPLALAIGAAGNVVGSTLAGTEVVWNISSVNALTIVLANVLGLLVGFTLGVLLRSSAAAIVAYFVYSMVLPTLAGLLASSQTWFRDLQPWVDFNFSQSRLFEGGLPAEQWGQLAVSGALWLLLPLAVGLVLTMRAEVK